MRKVEAIKYLIFVLTLSAAAVLFSSCSLKYWYFRQNLIEVLQPILTTAIFFSTSGHLFKDENKGKCYTVDTLPRVAPRRNSFLMVGDTVILSSSYEQGVGYFGLASATLSDILLIKYRKSLS